jgi:hypothetical protein
MPNRWGIPKEVEEFVKKRDVSCVYCGIKFVGNEASSKLSRSWEHIVNDIKLNSSDNVALCCRSCNSSKGAKKLEDWLQSDYCSNKGIDCKNVAEVVKKYLNPTGKS